MIMIMRKNGRNNLLIVMLLLIVQSAACPLPGSGDCRIEINNKNGKPVALQVEIADTDPMRMKGLMDRKKMSWNRGMLFVFDSVAKQNFWMKNTYIPLSIAYIGKNGTINEIYDMKPLDISVTYPSNKPAGYALEVNRGWFEKNNITSGCIIVFHGCVSK
jgi:uncharacterized protein